jgi:hypothetical protein
MQVTWSLASVCTPYDDEELMQAATVTIPAAPCSASSDSELLQSALLAAVKHAASHDIQSCPYKLESLPSKGQALDAVMQPLVACLDSCMSVATLPKQQQAMSSQCSDMKQQQWQDATAEEQHQPALPKYAAQTTCEPKAGVLLCRSSLLLKV